MVIELGDIEAARERIQDKVRRTPVIRAAPARAPICDGDVWLKLECLQISGSFKARGATNKVASLDDAALARGLVTASGGNHGLGVAYAAWRAGVSARIYLPANTPPAKADALRAWGAEVVREGAVWDDANAAALEAAARDGPSYVHPFADPLVIAGQGTVGLEIVEQMDHLDTLVVAIGGGGLISGVATAIKALTPATRVIGVEPEGAPTLYESTRARRLVTLASLDTAANTLAPRRSEQINLDIISAHVDDIVLVSDDAMRDAARWLWREFGVGVELGAAAAVAALQTGRVAPAADEITCALVCGAGRDGMEERAA